MSRLTGKPDPCSPDKEFRYLRHSEINSKWTISSPSPEGLRSGVWSLRISREVLFITYLFQDLMQLIFSLFT